MNVAVGALLAVLAGGSFAMAGVLQQRVAARTSTRSSLSPRLLLALLHERTWVAGIGLAMASYGLQALALSKAPLAVVQPLLVTELVFAIPISARLYGHRLQAREWIGILTVSFGLAATVWGASPKGGVREGSLEQWTIVAGSIVAGALLLALVGHRRRGLARAVLYAAGAALVFALSSAFLAVAVKTFATAGIGGLARPAIYAMGASSIGGTLLLQSAFQSGPLAVTLPMVDWAEPLVAVYLGVTVLGQAIDTTSVHLTLLSIGAIAALVGIVTLDTSPRVRFMHQPATTSPTEAAASAATERATATATDASRAPGMAEAVSSTSRASRLGRGHAPRWLEHR